MNIELGQKATFSIGAAGQELTYQWYYRRTCLSGDLLNEVTQYRMPLMGTEELEYVPVCNEALYTIKIFMVIKDTHHHRRRNMLIELKDVNHFIDNYHCSHKIYVRGD